MAWMPAACSLWKRRSKEGEKARLESSPGAGDGEGGIRGGKSRSRYTAGGVK